MRNFAESALIALDAIWSAKLRSFMTVLGNIVAVTSIIAVVSLIQGLNASVKQAILHQAGADSFNIQQFPVTRSDEEFEKVRSNPRVTLDDMRAIRRYGSELLAAVMADSQGRGRISYRDKSIDNVQVEGVSSDYVNFSRSEEHTSELQSLRHLVCRLLLEKKKKIKSERHSHTRMNRVRDVRQNATH